MRNIVPSLAVAILAVTAGCADTTSPAAMRSAPSVSAIRLGDPPPPPADTAVVASTSTGSSFAFSATYFMNPPGTAGFVHFSSNDPSVTVSPNAQIRYHRGTVSGMGMITAFVDGGTVSIDLANVSSGQFNSSCKGSCAEIPFTGTFTDKSGVRSIPTDGVLTIGAETPAPESPPTHGE